MQSSSRRRKKSAIGRYWSRSGKRHTGMDGEKNTFVRLYGLEKCEELVRKYTDYAISALSVFEDTEYIIALAHSLTIRRV